MARRLNELDFAALRLDFRRLYRELGYEESLVVLYELLKSTEILAEIITEERRNEEREDKEGMES
jgi:hypothetical protein